MESNKIYAGKMKYKDENYSFSFYNHLLIIIPEKDKDYAQDIEDKIMGNSSSKRQEENVEGITNDNRSICFIQVKFSKMGKGCLYSYVPAYIIGLSNIYITPPSCENVESMIFNGECIDRFFFPKKSVEISHENKTFSLGKMKDNEKVYIINEDKFNFTSNWLEPIGSDVNNVLKMYSNLKIDFSTPKSINEIIECYKKVNDFFSFLNHRKIVKFTNIVLTRKILVDDSEEKEEQYNLFIEYPEKKIELKDDILGCVRIENCDNHFVDLFNIVTNNEFLTNYYPYNNSDFNEIDINKYIQISAAFESEFTRKYPKFKTTINANYKFIKDDIKKHLTYQRKKLCDNGKKKKYNKYFSDIIESLNGTLDEMILYSFQKYDKIIYPMRKHLEDTYILPETKNSIYSKAFAEKRNKISHGDELIAFTDYEIISYEMLEYSIYCLVLDLAGFNEEEMKTIINKIF
jgi:hypothetical protein